MNLAALTEGRAPSCPLFGADGAAPSLVGSGAVSSSERNKSLSLNRRLNHEGHEANR